MTMLDTWSYAADGPVASTIATPIRVTPTRKYIEKRFPTLAFTVDTGGRPYFEVLLATDRSLFEAANTSKRTPATFYASREHSGLIRAGDDASIYLVPTAVVQRFAGAREIFYTAACYGSAQGQDPAYAMPPADLARSAPSVGVASDFYGRALAASFALPADLLRVRDNGHNGHAAGGGAYAVDEGIGSAYGDADSAADLDRAGGEDGYGMTAALEYEDDYGPMTDTQGADEDVVDAPAAETAHTGGASLDYYDGYDDPIPMARGSASRAYGDEGGEYEESPMSAAQQSTYAAGARTPAMLEDEDEERRSRDDGYGTSYDDGYSGDADNAAPHDGAVSSAAYGDEADEVGGQPAYESFDTPTTAVALSPKEQRLILDAVIAVDRPADGYATVVPSADSATAPAEGLRFGILPFTQRSGSLGALVAEMEKRDGPTFQRIFGAKAADMRSVANAKPVHGTTDSVRLAPRMVAVDGKELWREPWLTRFRQAGAHKPFQALQNEVGAKLFIAPMVKYAHQFGVQTDRGLAMLAYLASRFGTRVDYGVSAALAWVGEAVMPYRTTTHKVAAEAAIGMPLSAFQCERGIYASGQWSGETIAAVMDELRRTKLSPVPLPARSQVLDALVSKAKAGNDAQFAAHMEALRKSTTLKDTEYTQ